MTHQAIAAAARHRQSGSQTLRGSWGVSAKPPSLTVKDVTTETEHGHVVEQKSDVGAH